jgi:hypothetical protein
LYDLAARFAGTLPNMRIRESEIRPADGLAVAAMYPLFPEIAERYGCGRGSYQFRVSDRYIGIEQFVTDSFAKYREHAPDCLAIATSTCNSQLAMEVFRKKNDQSL